MMYRYKAVVNGVPVEFEAERVIADGYQLAFFVENTLVTTLCGDDEIDSLELQA